MRLRSTSTGQKPASLRPQPWPSVVLSHVFTHTLTLTYKVHLDDTGRGVPIPSPLPLVGGDGQDTLTPYTLEARNRPSACWEITSEVSMVTAMEVHFIRPLVNLQRHECDSRAMWLAQGFCEHMGLTREENANLVSLWGTGHEKKTNCFMNYCSSISRGSLMHTLESFSYTLLNFTRK